jgi:hypothetical protein
MIFRTASDESEYAMAEWVLSSEGTISGVRLTAKAATSSTPFIRVCPIDIATCDQSGNVLALSEGGLRSYKPKTPYTLPETIRISSELADKPIRPTRTDFKTNTSAALPVVIIPTSEPPLKPNQQFASYDSDNFEGIVSVFNKSPTSSMTPITIASVSASFRLIGEGTYSSVKSFEFLDGVQLPITIEPRQSWSFKFRISVPRSDNDAKLELRWFNRAFIARRRPLRLKLLMKEIEGEQCSLVIEHVFDPLYPLEKQKETDLAFFYFDDPELWTRNGVHVEKGSEKDQIIAFSGSMGDNKIDVTRLQKIVYHAIKTRETEIDLEIGGERGDGAWEWGASALVDLSCNRVYAFKILLKQGRLASRKAMACLGYVLCPEYGDVIDEYRDVQYAVEKVKFPELEYVVAQEVVQDDPVDDFISDPQTPLLQPDPEAPTVTAIPSASRLIVSDDLNVRLASIDSSLARIAAAVELIADRLASKEDPSRQ